MNKPILIAGRDAVLQDIKQYKTIGDMCSTTVIVKMDLEPFSELTKREYIPITNTGNMELENQLVYLGYVEPHDDGTVMATFICKNPMRLIRMEG